MGPRALAEEVVPLLGRPPEEREALIEGVASEDGGFTGEPGALLPGNEVLRLPGGPSHPFTPPSLGVRPDAPKVAASRAGLRDWEVPALVLHPGDAAPLLRTFRTSASGAGSVSLPHVEVLLRAAESFAAARRVVPQWVEEADEDMGTTSFAPRARWRPVLDPQALSWLRSYAGAVPPLLRAHHAPEDDDPWEAGSAVVVDALEALCAFTDQAVRERLHGREFRLPAGPRLYADWVRGLLLDDGAVPEYVWGREQSLLSERLSEWFGVVHRQAGAVRPALRLVEPYALLTDGDGEETEGAEPGGEPELLIADEDASWRLEVWVQSVDEPSLMLTLEDARAGEGADWLPRDHASALEAALVRAADLYPRLERDDVRERGVCTLDTAQACEFLTRFAPSLGEAGIGLLLPPWAGTRETAAVLRLDEPHEGAIDGDPLLLLGWHGVSPSLLMEELESALGGRVRPRRELEVELVPLPEQTAEFWAPSEPLPFPAPVRPFTPLAHWESPIPVLAEALEPIYEAMGETVPGDEDRAVRPGAGRSGESGAGVGE